jgi:hypothetical protein
MISFMLGYHDDEMIEKLGVEECEIHKELCC